MSITRDQAAEPPGSIVDETTVPRASGNGEIAKLPRAIGKYQVTERLGSGAMGVVYKCRHPDLDRPVAVKVMLAAQHAGPREVNRFQREARAASRLSHPNVVQVFDVGVDGEITYFVMEYVEGHSLDRLIGSEWLTLERTLRLVYQVSLALQSAHDQGIVHRDIKPSNILIDKSGQIKLADFGLAKTLHDSKALSASGDLIGTPRYMSPEQVLQAPEEVDARTDIYSLGAVMYEALAGRPPVDGPNLLSILRQLTDEEPAPVEKLNPAVPDDVAAICRRAMARIRDDRFATGGKLAEAIHACLVRRLLGRPLPEGGTHDSMLSLAIPARAAPRLAHRNRPRWLLSGIAGAVCLVVATIVGLQVFRDSPSDGSVNSTADTEPVMQAPEVLRQANRQLAGVLEVPEGTTVRERFKSILEDLTSVLKRGPANNEARLLRARAYRRTGEHLAAIDDLNELLRRDPKNLPAVNERLRATYQLYVLYLGNINEPLLRPRVYDKLKEDVVKLRQSNDAVARSEAELAAALSRHDYTAAARLAASPPVLRRDQVPDWCMLECDAAFHAAGAAYAAELASGDEEKPAARRLRQDLEHRASQALRRGLDGDPGHVGLLFLKANSFQKLAIWSAEEGEDRVAAINRQRVAFERTFDGLRNVTLRAGCDTMLARAVLLSNFDRNDPALDQITDALSCRPTVPYLQTLKSWLRMQVPPDGILSAEETYRMIRDFQGVIDTSPEEYNTYFVRALLYAAAGHSEDARGDLRRCRTIAGSDTIPASNYAFQEWYALARDSTSRYLNATVTVLDHFPVPSDVRVRLSEELLKRLTNPAFVEQDHLEPEEVSSLKGWTHVRLAQASAEREDRPGVLRHVREALALKVPDLTPDALRADGTLSPWNEDEEFKHLYAEFTRPAEPVAQDAEIAAPADGNANPEDGSASAPASDESDSAERPGSNSP